MIERRTIPGEQVAGATAELQALLDRCAASDPTFRADLVRLIDRPPFEIDPLAEIVRAIQAAQTTRGLPAEPQGVSFWTDAALFAEVGIPCALIGPRGHGLHSAEEWVDLDSCVELAEILKETAIRFCNSRG
jgi:acetylornithine deacetylase